MFNWGVHGRVRLAVPEGTDVTYFVCLYIYIYKTSKDEIARREDFHAFEMGNE